jgi:serine/threonine protein kinase/WD40 repeat protein
MGNSLGTQRLEDLRSYLLDSPDIVVHSLLATYKLFKVFHCAHEGYKHGGVIVKLFIPNVPEEDELQESGIKTESLLKPYRDATFLLQCRIWGLVHPNVVPYEFAEISSRSGILMRPYFGRNLFDRLYSQPRLTQAHQNWFALQLLMAVAQLHSVGVIHGDIKSENIFIIGSFQAVLSDLATFIKPVFLPLDDPVAATSLFFESGVKRRRCFIAPERFKESLTSRVLDEHGRRMTFFDKQFTADFARMDIFSAGLAIAEMFLEGQHLVDLPELLAYRSGSFDLESILMKISNEKIRNLVIQMTDRDPKKRPLSAVDCINQLNLPDRYQSVLIPLLTVINHPIYANADMRIMFLRENWDCVLGETFSITEYEPSTEIEILDHCLQTSVVSRGVKSSIPPLTTWSTREDNACIFPHPNLGNGKNFSDRLMKLWDEGYRANLQGTSINMTDPVNDLYLTLFSEHVEKLPADEETVTLVASLLGPCLTACSWKVSKIVCLDLMQTLSTCSAITDECLSDFLIPYVHDLIMAPHACETARTRAMECLGALVTRLSRNVETGLFSEYLFPLCMQVNHPSVIALAGVLMKEAARLSNYEAKKISAIQQFGERFLKISILPNDDWKSDLFNSLFVYDIFTDSARINEMLIQQLEGSLELSPAVRTALFNAFSPIIKTIKRVGSWTRANKTLLQNLILQYLYSDSLLEEPIAALEACLHACATFLSHLEVSTEKNMIIDLSSKIIPFIFHPVPLIRKSAQKVLVHQSASKISPVDQFVFLRNLLPKGCRTLIDLVSARRPLVGLSPEQFDALRSPNTRLGTESSGPARLDRILSFRTSSRTVSETTLRSTTSPPISQQLVVQIVNPNFPAPRPPLTDSENTLSNLKDWKYVATNTPFPLPDFGCLSGMDGSLLRLYDTAGSSSLQRACLNTYPCVPVVPHRSEWKPESLLLGTLNDFCSTGVAVPVVGIDSTDDGRIIAGAGADGTIRIWRTNALETESVVQSTRCIQIPNCSRIYTLKTLRNTKSVAVGNDNRLMVYRIDSVGGSGSMSGSTKLKDVPVIHSQEHQFGHVRALDHFDTDSSSCVIAACENGFIVNWDLRSNKLNTLGDLDPSKFLIPSSLVVSKDAHGLAVSTLSGHVVVLDNRFWRPVKTYHHSAGPISTMAHSGIPNAVWVSAGNDVGLFDLTTGGESKQTFSVNSNGTVQPVAPCLTESTGNETAMDNALTKLVKSESNSRCVLECNFGSSYTVLTGHNDAVVRHWQPSSATTGATFPVQLEPAPVEQVGSAIAQRSFQVTEASLNTLPNVAGRPCTVTEGHRDVILDMCIASLQYDVIATAGRDGLIKLWK